MRLAASPRSTDPRDYLYWVPVLNLNLRGIAAPALNLNLNLNLALNLNLVLALNLNLVLALNLNLVLALNLTQAHASRSVDQTAASREAAAGEGASAPASATMR